MRRGKNRKMLSGQFSCLVMRTQWKRRTESFSSVGKTSSHRKANFDKITSSGETFIFMAFSSRSRKIVTSTQQLYCNYQVPPLNFTFFLNALFSLKRICGEKKVVISTKPRVCIPKKSRNRKQFPSKAVYKLQTKLLAAEEKSF